MTSCRPSRRTSFPSLGGTTRSARVSPARGRALPRAGLPGVGHPVPPAGNWSVETAGSPTFLGNPHCALALLYDPGGTGASGPCDAPARPPLCPRRRLPRLASFEAQSHGFGTGCLRFAGRVAPTPRKTRFRLLARLFRTGLVTRRVPSKGFEVYPTSQPPFPSFHGARSELFFAGSPNSLTAMRYRWSVPRPTVITR